MTEYCGCCGREQLVDEDSYCSDCAKHRDKDDGKPPWMRTYLAQYGISCPYQVNEKNLNKGALN